MRNAMRWIAAVVAVAWVGLPAPAAEPPTVPARSAADVPDGFTFAAVGDLLETRPVMPLADPAFLKIDQIIQRADVAFGNGEIPIVDVTAPGVYPEAENGALNAFGVPAVAADLKAQGFAMVSRANNHSTDWGVAGMLMTDTFFDRAGIMHAGTGRDEDAARRVRFVETRWGRIGLAATTSTFEGNEPAGVAMGDVPGRPGASVVHTQPSTVVDRPTLDGLKRYYGAPVYHIDDTVGADSITVYGQSFVVGPRPGIRYEMDKHDVAAIVRAVRQGNAISNFLVFSTHCHEDASGIGNDVPQGAFLR
ncbi:MAG: CapA family protein, partial [Candidatus Eremiobacteraeota bacterium]|nr:CapA family protein [Candidatus Eremiobacteraeota bacterium]